MRGTSNVSIITASLFFLSRRSFQHKRNPMRWKLRVASRRATCKRSLLIVTASWLPFFPIKSRLVMGRKGGDLTTRWGFASITKGDYEPRLSRGLTNTLEWELLEIIRDNEKNPKRMCCIQGWAEERSVEQKIRKKIPFHFARVIFSRFASRQALHAKFNALPVPS